MWWASIILGIERKFVPTDFAKIGLGGDRFGQDEDERYIQVRVEGRVNPPLELV